MQLVSKLQKLSLSKVVFRSYRNNNLFENIHYIYI